MSFKSGFISVIHPIKSNKRCNHWKYQSPKRKSLNILSFPSPILNIISNYAFDFLGNLDTLLNINKKSISHLAEFPDGKILSISEENIHILNNFKSDIGVLQYEGFLTEILIRKDGIFITADNQNIITLWNPNIKYPLQIYKFHTRPINFLEISPTKLLILSNENILNIWDFKTTPFTLDHLLKSNTVVKNIFSYNVSKILDLGNDKILVAYLDGYIRMFDLNKKYLCWEFRRDDNCIEAANHIVIIDDKLIYNSGSYLILYDMIERKMIKSVDIEKIDQIIKIPNNKIVINCNHKLSLWDVSKLEKEFDFPYIKNNQCRIVGHLSDAHIVIIHNGYITIINPATGTPSLIIKSQTIHHSSPTIIQNDHIIIALLNGKIAILN